MNIKLNVEIKGIKIEMTLEELKQIQSKLNNLFGSNTNYLTYPLTWSSSTLTNNSDSEENSFKLL